MHDRTLGHGSMAGGARPPLHHREMRGPYDVNGCCIPLFRCAGAMWNRAFREQVRSTANEKILAETCGVDATPPSDRSFMSVSRRGRGAQLSYLRLLLGEASVDECALESGQIRSEQCPVAPDVLPMGKNPDICFVLHDHIPSAH
jgi:hypothetical protein